jgi:phage shock protein E
MIEFFKKLIGMSKTDYADLIARGAVIIDVRTRQEFSDGHIKGSVNIPVDQLANQIEKLKDKNKTIITCCASGMRSASAKMILKRKGFTNVHNGGSWFSLKKHVK